jgi:hypothetical protein
MIMQAKTKRIRINRKALRLIKDALASAKCERCGVDEKAQKAMRLYLDTWVVARLQFAVEIIEGELDS